MQAELWKGTHLLCPSPPRLGGTGCRRLPAHSLPCASAALLASKPRDRAKSPPPPSRSLPRGAAGLAAGFPAPGILHAGLAAAGQPGRELLLPSATLQLSSSWPHSGLSRGLLMASWQRQRGRYQSFAFSGWVSHISLSKGFTFLSLFLRRLSRARHAVPSVFQLPLYLSVELLSLLECLLSLCAYFAFFHLLFAFQQHMKASGRMRDCFHWFCLPGLSTSRSGLSPAFSGTRKGSYKL